MYFFLNYVPNGFVHWQGHAKDHHKMEQIASLLSPQGVGVYQCNPHYKDLLGSIIRVGYCILVQDFFLVVYMALDAEKAL